MKRFINPQPNEGLPYVNSDFYDVLQMQHIRAYGAVLDSMNDVKIGTSQNRNRGIIVNGITIVTDYDATTTTTVLNLKNSLVYIPGLTQTGDFYEPHPDLITNDTYSISSETFYIFTADPILESREFQSGTYSTVSEKKFYTIETELPETADFENLIHIRFDKGKSIRYLERLMRWNTSAEGEIFISGNGNSTPINFDPTTGRGFGDMHGFALCDGRNGTVELRTKMLIGYDSTASPTPTNNENTDSYDSTGVKNYGKIGNVGSGKRISSGVLQPAYKLKDNQLPIHNHNGRTDGPDRVLHHRHSSYQGGYYHGNPYYSGTPVYFDWAGCRGYHNGQDGLPGRGGVYNFPLSPARVKPGQSTMNNTITGGADLDGYPTAVGVAGTSPLFFHRHEINAVGQNLPHETRPPYIVMVYYQKIPLTYYS